MTARCRDGHESTELDYCSVCGAAMPKQAAAPVAPNARAAVPRPSGTTNAIVCPECSEPRTDPDARFCEVCRFDFVAGKPGPPPAGRAVAPPARAVSAPPPQAASPSGTTGSGWELVVKVDASLDVEPDPEAPCPQGVPDQVVLLDRDILVGRRDDRRDIKPELPLSDPGASRRHAKFVLNTDGSPALQDLASTNGTKLNAVDTTPGSRTTLKAGDEVTLGRWTRIVLRARP